MERYGITYSRRLDWSQEKNRISRIIEQKRRSGEEVIDLTVSNPTIVGLQYANDQIISALTSLDSTAYHPSPAGSDEARQAIVRYYGGHAIPVHKDQILLTASTSEAYTYIFRLLMNPGDVLLIPQPSYPLFHYLAVLDNVSVRPYIMVYRNGCWRIDIDSVESAITPETRALVVVNPNNPTGNFINQSDLDSLAKVCSQNNLALIIDEVFLDYHFDPRAKSLDYPSDILTFTLSGLSKVCGLPQMKLSWIVVRGPKRLWEQAMERLTVIADMYLSVSTPVQHAATTFLELSKSFQQVMLDRIENNLTFLKRCLSSASAEVLNVEGGWYGVLRLSEAQSDEAWAAGILERYNVLFHPGYFYDFPDEAIIVCSLLSPPKDFQAGVQRFRAYLDEEMMRIAEK